MQLEPAMVWPSIDTSAGPKREATGRPVASPVNIFPRFEVRSPAFCGVQSEDPPAHRVGAWALDGEKDAARNAARTIFNAVFI
jgi:hypothetical protein